jgi:hypothetical protein
MTRNGNRPGEGAAYSVAKHSAAEPTTSPPPHKPTCVRRLESRARTRVEVAAFILREAAKLDLRIGTNGCDLIIAPPRGMPNESYFSFQRAIVDHREEIIDLIMRESRA